MARKTKGVFIVPASLFTILILIVALALFIVRTNAFKRELRSRVVSALERASGGRVELGSIHLYWRTLAVRFDNLVVHGTEPAGSPPLLQVASIGMQLKAASLLKQRIDFSTIVAERPRVYLLVRPDGRINIPIPHETNQDVVNQLIDLAVARFELNHGNLLINQKNYSLDLKGRDLHVLTSYETAQADYHLGLSAHRMSVMSGCCLDLPLSLDMQAVLKADVLDVREANIASGGSTLRADGTISHFNQPQANFHFNGDLDVPQMAQFIKMDSLREGNVFLKGAGRFDSQSGFTIDGDLRASQIAYRSPVFAVDDVSVVTGFHLGNNRLLLNTMAAKTHGGTFDGSAKLDNFRALHLSGRLANFGLQQFASFLNRRIPWSGRVSGPLSIDGPLALPPSETAFQTTLQITLAEGGIPLSGTLEVSKGGRSGLRFGKSQLALPATQASFQGSLRTGIDATIDSTNLADLASILDFFKINHPGEYAAVLLPGGSAHFTGRLTGPPSDPSIEGAFSLARFKTRDQQWNQLRGQGKVTAHSLDLSTLAVESPVLHASGSGHIGLYNWQASNDAPVRLRARYSDVDVPKFLSRYTALRLPVQQGIASGTIDLSGSVQQPSGNAHLTVTSLSAYGEDADRMEASLAFSPHDLKIQQGLLEGLAGGRISFSGSYTHAPADWRNGSMSTRIDGGNLPVKGFKFIHAVARDLTGRVSTHVQFAADVVNSSVHPVRIDGHTTVRNLSSGGTELGSIDANISTKSQNLSFALQGDLRDSRFHGSAEVKLTQEAPVSGDLVFDRISLATLQSIIHPSNKRDSALQGVVNGGVQFQGSLARPASLHSTVRIDRLQLTSPLQPDFDLHNEHPIVLEVADSRAAIRNFELVGKDTELYVTGSAGYSRGAPLSLDVNGAIDLRILQLFDSNLGSAGRSLIKASVAGTLDDPKLKGRLELKNASLVLRDFDFANGLSAVNGAVNFTENRATIERLTATSGGGLLRVGGFVSYGGSSPLVYHVDARADAVRLRYSNVSVTANSDLRLTGTSSSSVLSGTATISRIVLNANTDVGNVLSAFAAPVATPANQKDLLTGLHLDIGIESAPDLQISTALSRDVEAGIDLRLRGTPDRPVLLGSVSANQGDIRAFGTRYRINHGQINFVNTSKIEPALDLDLQTQVRGITVDVTISGTLNRLNIAYRSDPPLQPRDIIALLTVGRTPQEASNVQTTQSATQTNALQSGASSVLGQAMTPASGLSKLFGVTNIKLDPLVQGISNTTQSRLTLEQQVSRAITVTYVTNLEQTSEQIFRIEWSIDPQYSLVAVRDDNGEFGIDIQYKKRFK